MGSRWTWSSSRRAGEEGGVGGVAGRGADGVDLDAAVRPAVEGVRALRRRGAERADDPDDAGRVHRGRHGLSVERELQSRGARIEPERDEASMHVQTCKAARIRACQDAVAIALLWTAAGAHAGLVACRRPTDATQVAAAAQRLWRPVAGHRKTHALRPRRPRSPVPSGDRVQHHVGAHRLHRGHGATRVIPGSHLRDHSPAFGTRYDSVAAEMPRGSVLVWHGSLWHGGGGNHTGQRRVGIAMNYCAGLDPPAGEPAARDPTRGRRWLLGETKVEGGMIWDLYSGKA